MSLVPIALGQAVAHGWLEHLHKLPEVTRVEWTGALRRQQALMESVDLLVEVSIDSFSNIEQELTKEGFIEQPTLVAGAKAGTIREYHLSMDADDRKIPICLYITHPDKFYPNWVITSGDHVHNAYLGADDEHFMQKLQNKYPDGVLDEEAVYQVKAVPFILPTLREQGSIHIDPLSLVSYQTLQGDLHMHTTYSDGANSIEDMVRGCIARGYQYMAITDHSVAAKVANGLSVERLKRQHEAILEIREKYPEITILHGSEVDIMPDATLDFNDEILGSLDLVVASIHTSFYLSKKEQTARIVAAIASPHVDIIGHPTGRMLGRRDGYELDFEEIFAAATTHRVALELNSNPSRLDLDPLILRLAQEADCLFSIDSDAHSSADLERIPAFGIGQARRGWLTPDHVINTWNWDEFSAWLQ
jgi:DNA polymerase (family 10)